LTSSAYKNSSDVSRSIPYLRAAELAVEQSDWNKAKDRLRQGQLATEDPLALDPTDAHETL